MRAVLHLPEIEDAAADRGESSAFSVALENALESAGVTVVTPDSVVQRERVGDLSGTAPADVWLTVGCGRHLKEAGDAAQAAGMPWALALPEPVRAADLEANADALRQADAVVVIGSGSAHAVAPYTFDSRIVQLAPFIDTAPYSAAYAVRDQHKAAIASRLQLPLASPWLLVLVPPQPVRSGDSFTMLARVCSRLVMLDWYLVVGAEDRTLGEVRTLLPTVPEHRLRLFAPLSAEEQARLCVSCDFLVWPALRDAGLETLLQAQAAGLPVVACTSERVRERVHDGVTGRLAKADNAESLAHHVSFLLHNPTFIPSLGAQGRELALNDHDIRSHGQKLRHALEKLIEARQQ
jgi:glycosyltransferase involved in cell wall biosynthesis